MAEQKVSSELLSSNIKAFVSFDGAGIPNILDSFNVSSITDNGIGLYTVNITKQMLSNRYVVLGTTDTKNETVVDGVVVTLSTQTPQTNTAFRVMCKSTKDSVGNTDRSIINCLVVHAE